MQNFFFRRHHQHFHVIGVCQRPFVDHHELIGLAAAAVVKPGGFGHGHRPGVIPGLGEFLLVQRPFRLHQFVIEQPVPGGIAVYRAGLVEIPELDLGHAVVAGAAVQQYLHKAVIVGVKAQQLMTFIEDDAAHRLNDLGAGRAFEGDLTLEQRQLERIQLEAAAQAQPQYFRGRLGLSGRRLHFLFQPVEHVIYPECGPVHPRRRQTGCR